MSRDLPAPIRTLLHPYDPRVVQIVAAARAAILREAGEASELWYDSYNAVAGAFTFTGTLPGAFCHIAAYAKHVNLGFNRGAELDDPTRILQGSGKLIRHVRLNDPADVEADAIVALIAQAAARAERGEATDRKIVIKPASARKRRPES